MSSAKATSVIDRLLDPVTECLTPEVAERIVKLRLGADLQSRLDELATKANDGALTPDERLEYEEYVDGIDLFSILQAKARLSLRRHPS